VLARPRQGTQISLIPGFNPMCDDYIETEFGMEYWGAGWRIHVDNPEF
jgi:hypothetical protein